jgi:hypothetical protein
MIVTYELAATTVDTAYNYGALHLARLWEKMSFLSHLHM